MNLLLEKRMNQMISDTANQTPRLASRSDFVTSEYIGMSKFGIFNFRTTSQTNPGYYWFQSIEVPDLASKVIDEDITPEFIKGLLEDEDIKVPSKSTSSRKIPDFETFKREMESTDIGFNPFESATSRKPLDQRTVVEEDDDDEDDGLDFDVDELVRKIDAKIAELEEEERRVKEEEKAQAEKGEPKVTIDASIKEEKNSINEIHQEKERVAPQPVNLSLDDESEDDDDFFDDFFDN